MSNLIALAVLFGGVTLSRPALAEDPVPVYNYFYGNQDYTDAGGIDLSGVTDGIQLQITSTDAATITFNGSSFTPTEWLPETDPTVTTYSSIAAISVASGDVSNAKTIILDGTISATITYDKLWIYGGFTKDGKAEGNEVGIQGGNLSTYVIRAGASNGNGDVTNNKLLISGEEITITGTNEGAWMYGGYASNGSVDGNIIEISGGTLSNVTLNNVKSIYGARANVEANNNKVLISGKNTTITGVSGGMSIYAGYASTGSVDGNITEISGGKIENVKSIYGGYAASSGKDATNNKILITGGEINGKGSESTVYMFAGYSVYGSAENNLLEISGGTIKEFRGMYAGEVDNTAATGNVINNKILITGGSISGNSAGLMLDCGYSNGISNFINNVTVITGGEISKVGQINGANSYARGGEYVKANKVQITGGTITGRPSNGVGIHGACDDGSNIPLLTNNSVEISGGTLSKIRNISGAEGYKADAEVSNNQVLITGGTIAPFYKGDPVVWSSLPIYGGYSKKSGTVTGNTVAITGGTLQGTVNVYGGYIETNGGTATNNTVIIGDNVQWVKNADTDAFNLYGGYIKAGTGTVEDNTLVVDGKNITVTSVNNFDTYLFRVSADIDGTIPMLNTTNAITLLARDTIKVTADESTPNTVILANNVTGTVSGSVSYDLSNGNDITGGGVAINSNQLVYTMGTITQWTDVQPTTISGNTVVVDGNKDGSNNPLATVNGGTQTFKAGTSGKTEWQNVYGGYSSVQVAVIVNNAVTVNGTAIVEGNVYGGYSENGNVIGNTVNIQNSGISGVIYGGYSPNGNVSDNIVNIQGGEIISNIYGGKSDNASAIVSGNTINWTAGTVKCSEIKANNINITGTAVKYLGTAGIMTADKAAVLGDGTNTATFTVGNGTDASALTFASGLDAKANTILTVATNSSAILQGTSTLEGTVSGAGKVIVDGTTTANADAFTQTGGLEVKDSDDVLNLTEGTLSKDVTNNGIVKLDGATLDGAHVTTGTLEFAKDISLDVSYVAAPTNIVDSKVTLTVTGENKMLEQTVSGAGKVVIDGTISADANRFTQTGGLEVQDTLAFTSRGLDVDAVGGFTQTAGSNITVVASNIEANSNTSDQAMFTGVDDASKFDVSAGALTLTGTLQDGKYYVLAAGTAVDAGFVTSNLWKLENISLPDMLMVDFEYDTNVLDTLGSVALKLTNAVSLQEANTSGLAAVQQGNMAVAKEFTGEVENHLGFMNKPSLKGDKAKVRDVASTNKDDYKVETVKQGKANEVMPVHATEKDKYDKEIWASYIRTKETTEGMKLGAGIEGNNTAQYNGAVVGVDFYSSKKAIAGMALSYTVGDIDSYSVNTFTRNKSKYYGVSFYDRVTNGNTALIYDIGYIRGDNDISQYYNGRDITADVKTDTYTAGVRYEAEFGTEKSRVVPFASFRYMRQNNKDYTNSHNTRFEVKNQNLYIPKVGIAWTGDFVMPKSAWTWRPSVEAGYVWNLGDRSVDGNAYVGAGVAGLEYDTVDKSSYYARAGMEFMTKNFTAGVFYRYLKGDAVRNNKWNVNVSWAF